MQLWSLTLAAMVDSVPCGDSILCAAAVDRYTRIWPGQQALLQIKRMTACAGLVLAALLLHSPHAWLMLASTPSAFKPALS